MIYNNKKNYNSILFYAFLFRINKYFQDIDKNYFYMSSFQINEINWHVNTLLIWLMETLKTIYGLYIVKFLREKKPWLLTKAWVS